MLLGFRLKINNEYVKILRCYTPSAGDEPEFFYKCKDVLNQSKENHGMIVGDLNTTLNLGLDMQNYKTDSHKISRMVINNWIINEEMMVFYRFTNGNEQIWNYRCKETHNKTLRGRIYYVLGTPSLASAIYDVKHIFHEYELTDHASSYFTIDFLPTEVGPGVFRAHHSLLKH